MLIQTQDANILTNQLYLLLIQLTTQKASQHNHLEQIQRWKYNEASSRANIGDLPPLEEPSDTEPPLEEPSDAERLRFTVSDADIDMFEELRQKTMLRAYKEYNSIRRASGEEEIVAPVGEMNFDELY